MAVMDFGRRNTGSFGTALFSPVKALVEWVVAYRNSRRAYDELSRLTDRELEDLGISRYDIPTIARESRKSS